MSLAQKYIKEIFEAQNTLRTNPTGYVPYLEQMAQSFEGNRLYMPGGSTVMTHEGANAVYEAIDFLNNQTPVHALTYSDLISKASQDHANDIEANGFTGHKGSDGSGTSDRVMRYGQWSGTLGENLAYSNIYVGGHEFVVNLLIDDGVKTRGHRKNIFNPDFNFVGIGLANHPTYTYTCVMDYATEIFEKDHSNEYTPSSDYSVPKYNSKLGLLHPKKVNYDSYKKQEEYKQPEEGAILDYSEVPESIRQQIDSMGIRDNAKIQFVNGAYKISYTKPSAMHRFNLTNFSYKTFM